MIPNRVSSSHKLRVIVGSVVLVGLGVAGLAGAQVKSVYPTSGAHVAPQDETAPQDTTPLAGTSDIAPPQVDWVNGPLVVGASTLASSAAAASSIGGNFPNIAAAGLGDPNHIEVSAASAVAERSLAMRFGSGGTLYWVAADANAGLTAAQIQAWPRQCACGGVVSLGSASGVLLNQAGRPHSVTWLDGTGYRWSVIVPPGSLTTDLQVEGLARSLVAHQVTAGVLAPLVTVLSPRLGWRLAPRT
jgi:hypothetical protein